MAIWHFRVGLVPREMVLARYKVIPISIPEGELAGFDFWKDFHKGNELEDALSTTLAEISSWSKERRCWAEKDGSEIAILYKNNHIEWVTSKIDARSVTSDFLETLIDLARMFNCLLLANETYVIEPEINDLNRHFSSSTAYRYLKNPVSTLRSIPRSPTEITNIKSTEE